MNPAIISFAFFALFTTIVTVEMILPSFNLHMSLDREAILYRQAKQIILDNRFANNQTTLQTQLTQANSGYVIDSVTATPRGNYLVYNITFHHENLFLNQFFSKADAEAQKTFTIIAENPDALRD